MKVKDYKDLKVWQKGIEIVDKVYALTAKIPQRRIVRSDTSNEEGFCVNPIKCIRGIRKRPY